MIMTPVPGMRRGTFFVIGSAIVLAALISSHGFAQAQDDPKPSSGTTKKDASAPKKDAETAPKKTAEPATAAKEEEADVPAATGNYEIFKDDRAEEALGKLKSVGKSCPDTVVAAVKIMAAGEGEVDNDTIQKFVQGMAFKLTNKSSINALINPSPVPSGPNQKVPPVSREIGIAVDNLIDPLLIAKAVKNKAFLTAYNKELLATLPPLLNNHLVSRVQAAIVLAQTGNPQVVPIFLTQLKDPKQTVWVKLWATRAITNLVDGGRAVDSALSATEAGNAAKVVADYLLAEKELPWPAELRALETLGALRQPAVTTAPQKAEIAAIAMRYLADPEARLEVRAEAAKALGMFQVGSAVSKYNFSLIAYYNGLIAADIAEKVNANVPEKATASAPGNLTQAEYLTGLLVSQLYQSFNGIENARESGILKVPAAASSQAYLKQVSDLQFAVAKACVDLIRGVGNQRAGLKKELGNRISALKIFLAKNPPKDFHLVPNGPRYRAPDDTAAVAEAPTSSATRPKPGSGR